MEAYVELAPPDCRRPRTGSAFRTTWTGTEVPSNVPPNIGWQPAAAGPDAVRRG